MKLFVFLFILFTTSLCFSQEIIQSTKANWAGGPCCIHGINWATKIKVPENASVKIITAYSKENGYAAAGFYWETDTTLILQGKYQYNDANKTQKQDESGINEEKSKIEYEGHFYWMICINDERHEIEVKNYKALEAVKHP